MPTFVLPPLLRELIDAGRWPRTPAEASQQEWAPRVTADRVQALAPEESRLYLDPPPFTTIRALMANNPFWSDPMADPAGIDPDLAIVLGDFGVGSDAPIALDYRLDAAAPRVIRLRWGYPHGMNSWVVLSPDFAAFAALLDL